MAIKSKSPFQPMRSLTTDELRTLRASVETHGFLEPIVVDEHDNIIDGHHRVKIGKTLGIDPPRRVVKGHTDDEKMALARTLNWARRQLSTEERRDFIAEALREAPKASNREIARRTGFDDKTVAAVRKALVETAEIPHTDTTIGADGVERKAKRDPKPKSDDPELPDEIVDAVLRPSPEVKAALDEISDDEPETLFDRVVLGLIEVRRSLDNIENELDGSGLSDEEWLKINEHLAGIAVRAKGIEMP